MKKTASRIASQQFIFVLFATLLVAGCAEPGVKKYCLDFEGDYDAHFGKEQLNRIWRGKVQFLEGNEIAVYDEFDTTGARFILFCQRPPRGSNDTGVINSDSGSFRAYMIYGYAPGKQDDAIPDLELIDRMWRQKELASNPDGPPYWCQLKGSLRLVMRSEGVADRITVDLSGSIPITTRQTIPTSLYTQNPVPTNVRICGNFAGHWDWVHPEGYSPM